MNAQTDTTSAMQTAPGFNIPDPTQVTRLEGTVSDAEWAARVQLAATALCLMK